MKSRFLLLAVLVSLFTVETAFAQPAGVPTYAELDPANPVRELPERMVGHAMGLAELEEPPDMVRARLGRWLFFDTRLSVDGTVSCATCHMPFAGFSQPTPVSTGIRGQKGGRKAPSFLNVAFANYPETFWDGRAANLEEQAKEPIENPIEMGGTHEAVVAKIAATGGYRPFFEEAFGDSEVTIDRIAKAIADYERTRLSGDSRVDKWNEWDPDTVGYDDLLTEEEILGNDLFFGEANCSNCHSGPHFTDSSTTTSAWAGIGIPRRSPTRDATRLRARTRTGAPSRRRASVRCICGRRTCTTVPWPPSGMWSCTTARANSRTPGSATRWKC